MRLRLFNIIVVLLLCFSCFYFNDGKVKKIDFKSMQYNKFVYYDNGNLNNTDSNYLGKISIPKIDIERYLYNIDSAFNNVDKNIEVLKDSDMPDKVNGNFILASHSGNGLVAYFHNLYKLSVGDEVIINYNNKDYEYIISKIYDVQKTGKILIKRDKNKTAITLITCKGDDKQLVVIGYLK